MLLKAKFTDVKLHVEPDPGWETLRMSARAPCGSPLLLLDKIRGDGGGWWLKVLWEGRVWWVIPWDVVPMNGEKLVLDEVE